MNKENKTSKKIENKYKQITIDLEEFNKLESNDQYKKVEETLNKMWEEKVNVEKGYVMRCIKLSVSKFDDELHLPKHLLVEKNSKELVFSFKEHRNTLLLILLFGALLLVAAFSATYSAMIAIKQSEINIDIDGDGIADINIDLDGDGVADINISTNKDKKPNLNVDYKGNRKSIFNIDSDKDNVADKNLINDAIEGVCKLNCDSNGDGWPDYNIDLDGDGTSDVDIDTNDDKNPDLNIDLNGDGIPDLNIDDDNDGKCDRNCTDTGLGNDYIYNGSSTVTGDQNNNLESNNLKIYYEDYGELSISGLFPDDQQSVDVVLPQKKFTIKNESNFTIIYKLTWLVYTNTFTSQNFKYKLESTNGGFQSDYITVPWEETLIAQDIRIAPLETQEYIITFNLFGTGEPQNYDQNRKFSGFIKVGD